MTPDVGRMMEMKKDQQWAVHADLLIDGTGAPPIDDGILVIRNGRIELVGERNKVALPPGTKVYNFPKETILPGLIDAHNHPTLKPIGAEFKDYKGQFYDPDARLASRSTRNLRVDLLSGVTTIRVVGELNFVEVILDEEIRNGIILGPKIIPSGPRLGPTGGHVWIKEWSVDQPENIRQAIREYVAKGSRVIKLGLLDENPKRHIVFG